MSDSMTEGARRALQLARQLATDKTASQVDAVHLLWALLADESRAAAILKEHAINHAAIEVADLFADNLEESQASFSPHTHLPFSAHVDAILFQAQQKVRDSGRHAELGSEHLLWGLVEIESEVTELLKGNGLTRDAMTGHIDDKVGITGEPIAVDFEIDYSANAATEPTDIARILDAAANRAREGLRVLEDYCRFALDAKSLTRTLKNARHKLTQILLDRREHSGQTTIFASDNDSTRQLLIAARDTEQDVGTNLSTASEEQRRTVFDVLTANIKRVQEAARTLEEFGKLISAEMGARFGNWRYELYTIEKTILTAISARERLRDRNLYLLLTSELCLRPVESVVKDAIAGGVGIVQVREKTFSDQKLMAHCRDMRMWTREAGALLIVNDRPDIALLCDADGAHVGQEEFSVRDTRRILGPDKLIGVSTHTIEQAHQAERDGADYLGVGPVFSSSTKNFDDDELAGLELVTQVAGEIALPWFAIGGIDTKNVEQVTKSGASRIAVSGAICKEREPRKAASKLADYL